MLGEKILLLLSRRQDEPDYDRDKTKYTIETALEHLSSTFGECFKKDIVGKKVLDFGCGTGYQVLALAMEGADFVVGVEIRQTLLREAMTLSRENGVENKIKFVSSIGEDLFNCFDVVISQNSFEHYSDPVGVIELWKKVLKNGGKIYLTFGPLWFAPYGSHCQFFTKIPWVNILFKETEVMAARSRFRSDGAKRYEEIEGGLNRMTIKKFENIVARSGFLVEYVNYGTVKKIKFLQNIPFIREFFVNQVDCILSKIEK